MALVTAQIGVLRCKLACESGEILIQLYDSGRHSATTAECRQYFLSATILSVCHTSGPHSIVEFQYETDDLTSPQILQAQDVKDTLCGSALKDYVDQSIAKVPTGTGGGPGGEFDCADLGDCIERDSQSLCDYFIGS